MSMANRDRHVARGAVRPPSVPPYAGNKRKERDYEQDVGDETNINVVVRCRGRNDREVRENSGVVVSTTGVRGKSVELCMGPNAISNKTYHFDKVFSPAADQAIIFDDVVSPILSEMLAGFNCTIFAYGQTGTGKTYTMSGDMTDTLGLLSDAAGIIPRVLYSLFQKLEADGAECSVKCSFIELYNEELRDLLAADDSVKLKIYDDSSKKNHSTTVIQGMEETHIKSAADGIQRLQQGSHRRQVAATKCNDLSSRGHTVFTITTYAKRPNEGGEDFICSGKLNLVDLAGSENIQRSGAENKRAAEAGLINKSLLTLGRVINALVDKGAHIPYRESKLTRLLQDSLGGRTKTCIIATISPARSNLEETISTLDYAFRAKNIRNKPQVNSMISKKTLLKEFTSEIEKLKSELIATRQRNGVYLSNEQYEEITVESESRRILSEEQKARIETMEASLRNKVQELFNLTNTFTTMKRDNEATRTALETTKDVLLKTEIVLNDTRQSLDHETTLRKAHQMTEGRLRSIGSELISNMGESVQDLDRLHAKLRRRSDLHRQNQNSWSASTSQVLDVSYSVDNRLNHLQTEHSALLGDVRSRIESFVNGEIQRALHGRLTLQQGTTALDSHSERIERESSDARDEMSNVLEEIKVLREDVKAKVGEGLNGLSDAAARIAGEVISELEQFHAQLHTSYSGLGKDFKQAFDETTKELAKQREECDRLRQDLQNANLKQLETSLIASQRLEECVEAERGAAEKEHQELMEQMSALIRNSQTKREGRLTTALVSIKSDVIQSADDFGVANQAYQEGMEKWATNDGYLLDKVNKSKEEVKTKMKTDWNEIESRTSAIQASTEAVHEETIKIVDAQLQAMTTQMAALDDFVTRARRQNDARHNAHADNVRQISSHLGTTFSTLETAFLEEPIRAFGSEAERQTASLSETLRSLAEAIRQPLHTLTSHFTTTSLQNYNPTGETPAKKAWVYPTDLPRTSTGRTPPPPKPTSTTPPTMTKTPSRIRSTSKSPRKMISPRKIQVKEVYVDTPPPISKTKSTNVALVPPAPTVRTNSTQSMTAACLKEVDANTSSNATACGNQTISLPVSTSDVAKLDGAETIPSLPPAHNNNNSGNINGNTNPATAFKSRVPQFRATRSTVAAGKTALSMSVGPGIEIDERDVTGSAVGCVTTTTTTTTTATAAAREKENVPPFAANGGFGGGAFTAESKQMSQISRPATAMGYVSTSSNTNTNTGRRLRSSPPNPVN